MALTKKKKVDYEGVNVRVSEDTRDKVKTYIDNNGGKLGEFFDKAALEKLAGEGSMTHLKRLLERIEEANVQDEFPSAYQRAKDFVNNSK